ncbi:hypothetical protein E3N88_21754 [Mikania micrantha]|uniref:Uncharacterized protein n=1 Tax=Mikania micrantha TaxID=192012 RepID=A0A5N6N9Z3_9ASTR|nr:hypothetical protein E3N88_21754 [Mikania micrantha]
MVGGVGDDVDLAAFVAKFCFKPDGAVGETMPIVRPIGGATPTTVDRVSGETSTGGIQHLYSVNRRLNTTSGGGGRVSAQTLPTYVDNGCISHLIPTLYDDDWDADKICHMYDQNWQCVIARKKEKSLVNSGKTIG